MNEQQLSILLALHKMGPLTPGQLSRFLLDPGLAIGGFDPIVVLSQLKDDGLLEQHVSRDGIVYGLTSQGAQSLAPHLSAMPADQVQRMDKTSAEYSEVFAKEQDYIAQYTEQANAIVPIFLSIRQGGKILLKVSIIVNDVDTAKRITANWMGNAHKAYEAVWESIADGMPRPEFK
jgi:hypothetical protein